ncbi:MBL fold metallo-hydrolase [Niallia sp. Krafla_26]|uniref:MBL fold metallo-hydrolase n=1 Tax=Niallia sp. Krafla_26 TaxID=3064703 RepID=UPI003D17067A
MKIDILASGSAGNCIAITHPNKKTILIDAGIAKTKIDKRLVEVGIHPINVAAIFITHSHGDHIKGLPLANKYRIPVFAGEGEWKTISTVDLELQRPIKAREKMNLESIGFYVESFGTHHDAMDPLGYTVHDYCGHKTSICLDTGKVDQEMLEAMEYSSAYIIESNHEPNMVEAGDYPPSVKSRVLSDVGHLSNMQTAKALFQLVNGVGEKIYLTHLSSKNNMPGLAEMTTKRALAKKGFKEGNHYFLEVC